MFVLYYYIFVQSAVWVWGFYILSNLTFEVLVLWLDSSLLDYFFEFLDGVSIHNGTKFLYLVLIIFYELFLVDFFLTSGLEHS